MTEHGFLQSTPVPVLPLPLLPWNWAVAHPGSVRVYRQKERSDREIRKREKRRADKKRQANLKQR